MPCDLALTFGEPARALPVDPGQQSGPTILSAAALPRAPESLRSDQICATWSHHFYGDTPVEAVSLELDQPTCRHLGLWILAHVLHGTPDPTTLELDHPRSTLRRITLKLDRDRAANGEQPHSRQYGYRATHPGKHPWLDTGILPRDMPTLALTTSDRAVERSGDGPAHDTVTGLGPDRGAGLLAALLLDAGLPSNPLREYRLEGEHGFRGMGPRSPELDLWLPGSFGHLDTEMTG